MHIANSPKSIQASIIIPAFNEGENLRLLLDEIKTKLEDKLQIEIIVVDDGSSDGTYIVAKESGVKVIRHKGNKGYKEALKSGFAQASFPILVAFDPSGQYDPKQIITGLKIINENKADLAVSFTTAKSYRSAFFQLYLATLFNLKIKDAFSYFFCLKKEIFDNINFKTNSTGTAIELFINVQKKGYRLTNFEVETRNRIIQKIPLRWLLGEYIIMLKLLRAQSWKQ
jgi:glycosyltransferase involved in cell wall biosynthesis